MDIVNSIILGIVQGATEFLPISSSGHLILAREVLGIQVEYGLAFDAILQLATTLAVLIYFRKDIKRLVYNFFNLVLGKSIEAKEKNLLIAVIVGTIPAVVAGFLLEDSMETVFRNIDLVAVMLVVGALIMYIAEKISHNHEELSVKKGLLVGIFQAFALIPGMSRSGMTISGGLIFGLSREAATRFSFLLALPILAGSGIKKFLDLSTDQIFASVGVELLVGSIVSFIVGFIAIHFLIKFLKTHTMNVFVVYRVLLAIAMFIFI